MDCLGFFYVSDEGIHIDPAKIDKIREWRTPRNFHDVQRFNGIIQYLAQFLPNVTDYTSLMTGMCSNNREFLWTEFQDECFQKLKDLVCKNPICKPINSRIDTPIFMITDASATGIGGMYGQGPTWDTIRPAGFVSCKFTPTQLNYCTWEQELLAVLEALMRWEDKLIGLPFMIVTDHQALTFFNEAPTRSQRRMRWREYLSRFNFMMKYLKGEDNKVADALSRYFSSDEPGETHDIAAYVNADARLDPEGDDLTIACTAELTAFQVSIIPSEEREEVIRDHVEQRINDSHQLSLHKELETIQSPGLNVKDDNVQVVLRNIPKLYENDKFFSNIWKHPDRYDKFKVHKELLWIVNRAGYKVVCTPKGLIKGKSTQGLIIDACHQTLGHLGLSKMLEYVRRWFWWPNIKEDVEDFCSSCGKCQVTKVSHQKSPGWVHTMPIPTRPWENIGMDFTGPFIEIGGYDYILLVICRMTGMVHLIPTRTNVSAKDIARLFIKEVIRLHGIPESVVSDHDTKFTSQFWNELSKTLGQRLLMSTAYRPQTDGSSERAIQTMSQILRAVVNDYQTNWVEQLPLVEFAMNSATNASTGQAPFKTNYGWMPRMIKGVKYDSPREGVQQFADNRDVLDKMFDKLVVQRT